MANPKSTKWYFQTWFVILMLILFLPAGIILAAVNPNWKRNTRIIVATVGMLFLIVSMVSATAPSGEPPSAPKPRAEKPKPAPKPPEPEPEPEPEPAPREPTEEEKREKANAEKQRYANEMLPYVERTESALTEINNITDDFVNGKITSQEAAGLIAVQESELADIRSGVAAVTPPSDLQGFQTHYLDALDLDIAGCDKLVQGLEQEDPALIEEAATLFEQANSHMEQANRELEKHMPQSGFPNLAPIFKTLKKNLEHLSF